MTPSVAEVSAGRWQANQNQGKTIFLKSGFASFLICGIDRGRPRHVRYLILFGSGTKVSYFKKISVVAPFRIFVTSVESLLSHLSGFLLKFDASVFRSWSCPKWTVSCSFVSFLIFASWCLRGKDIVVFGGGGGANRVRDLRRKHYQSVRKSACR